MTPGGQADTRLRSPDPAWSDPSPPDPASVRALAAALTLPETVCSVMAVRGITAVDDAKRFLRPRLEHLHDPALLVDGARAAERIVAALRGGEKILVHGDYDVDGICATALFTRWLRGLGGAVVPFVPHRLRDGYDFSVAGLAAARDAGASLIVTADCGTVAHETVRAASAVGIDVVITDHHTVADDLPEAWAVVNPRRSDCPYPEKELCGTGLAYKMCELVGRLMGASERDLSEYLDVVALATVADLVPLGGENRVLVAYGLRRFASSRVLGLKALLAVASVPPDDVTAGKLGFVIAPRINAAGRIGDSMDALRLLLTEDGAEARRLAEQLDATNRSRREEDSRTLDEALTLLSDRYDPEADYGVVLWSEGWHPGVIGIVASRVVDCIHRPVVLVAVEGGRGRGSARSVPGFHLYDALHACAHHLGRFGGHRQAAGMDIEEARLPAFREDFNATARARLTPEALRPLLRPDLEVAPGEADLELAHWLSYLGPHGIGNPGPLFLARQVDLEGARLVGEKHLKAVLTAEGARLEAIGFGMAERHPPDTLAGSRWDVLFRLERNEWRGAARAQARIVDLRPAQ
ncbi:MAG TPA: single-stranded-DNA-specific exonuclease RecJ [Longimicrobiales bacterium]|nr:single-stranded-DNA-specific exonuclease RecJ [Longimicrobiales bacterium]